MQHTYIQYFVYGWSVDSWFPASALSVASLKRPKVYSLAPMEPTFSTMAIRHLEGSRGNCVHIPGAVMSEPHATTTVT